MIGPYRMEGYVDRLGQRHDRRRDRNHAPSLEHDADKLYFADELDHAAAVVHGRRSQEIQQKSPNRRRLVLTHRVEGLARDPDNANALFWNPAGAAFEKACAALGVASGRIEIIGGPKVYSLFLKMGYDAFHLCRAVDVVLPDGLPVFVRDLDRGEPEANLEAAGLVPGPLRKLSDQVSLTDWTRSARQPVR